MEEILMREKEADFRYRMHNFILETQEDMRRLFIMIESLDKKLTDIIKEHECK